MMVLIYKRTEHTQIDFRRQIYQPSACIGITYKQQMSCNKQQSPQQYLQNMLNDIKPNSKYMSEIHVEEYIDEIYMEIINGDTEVAPEPRPVNKDGNKGTFEDALRMKILSQAEKERIALEQKLSYLTNSINALSKYDEMRKPRSLRESQVISPSKQKEEWRREIEERGKELEKKKKEIEQIKKKKAQELKQMEQRVKQQQADKKKKEILEKVKSIQERSKKRQELIKQSNERYKQMKTQKSLHHRLSEDYNQKQLSFLEQRKKKLAEIRNIHKPLDQQELKQHEQRFMQNRKQKQQLRQREKRMNQSRSQSYQPFYKSVFYQKAQEESRNEPENTEKHRIEKMKQYAERIKERFVPEVDEKKKQQIQKFIDQQKRKAQLRAEKQRELLEKSKEKGKQYLQLVRGLPKKPRKKSADLSSSKTQRKQYPNYLTHTQKQAVKPWHNILNSQGDKQEKALLLQYQSQKYEQELRRKQQQVRIIKKGDSGEIDQQYFQMIKAKLDLLAEK